MNIPNTCNIFFCLCQRSITLFLLWWYDVQHFLSCYWIVYWSCQHSAIFVLWILCTLNIPNMWKGFGLSLEVFSKPGFIATHHLPRLRFVWEIFQSLNWTLDIRHWKYALLPWLAPALSFFSGITYNNVQTFNLHYTTTGTYYCGQNFVKTFLFVEYWNF